MTVPIRRVDIMVEDCGDCPFLARDKPMCDHGLSGGRLGASPKGSAPPWACPLRACDANVHLMSPAEREQVRAVRAEGLPAETTSDVAVGARP